MILRWGFASALRMIPYVFMSLLLLLFLLLLPFLLLLLLFLLLLLLVPLDGLTVARTESGGHRQRRANCKTN
jgi:hypothetical protein